MVRGCPLYILQQHPDLEVAPSGEVWRVISEDYPGEGRSEGIGMSNGEGVGD